MSAGDLQHDDIQELRAVHAELLGISERLDELRDRLALVTGRVLARGEESSRDGRELAAPQ